MWCYKLPDGPNIVHIYACSGERDRAVDFFGAPIPRPEVVLPVMVPCRCRAWACFHLPHGLRCAASVLYDDSIVIDKSEKTYGVKGDGKIRT